MFNIKKNQSKEEQNKMTVEEMKKAFTGLSEEDKKAFKQSIAEKTSTSEEVPQLNGEDGENQETENAVETQAEETAETEETAENGNNSDYKSLEARIAKLELLYNEKEKKVEKADKEEVGQLNEYEARWNN